MEPDLEAVRIPEPWQLTPGEEECLLDRVLGPLDIAKDPIRDGVATVAVQVDELGEGSFVALPRPFDQPRPHWRISLGALTGRFAGRDDPPAAKVQSRPADQLSTIGTPRTLKPPST